jgi:hypothetical protein
MNYHPGALQPVGREVEVTGEIRLDDRSQAHLTPQ